MRKFRDKDYVETHEEWFFCIVGESHPSDKLVAYLKYLPGDGIWSRKGKSFMRTIRTYSMQELLDTINFLKKNKPEYVFYDETIDAEMSCVPLNKISKYYRCDDRLREILEGKDLDKLESKVKELVESITEASGVDIRNMGITGSILLKIHHLESDIDLIVYGKNNFWKVLQSLRSIGGVKPLDESNLNGWIRRASLKYPISVDMLSKLARLLKNKYVYKGTPFSIHGVRLDEEVSRSYGEVIYRSLGLAKIRAVISDASESCFTPVIYRLSDVETEQEYARDVEMLACFDGTFTAMFEEGAHIEAFGKVEYATDLRSGRSFKWLVIGTFEGMNKEYIIPIEELPPPR
ncbi:MAG: hypothetical protein RMJ14_03040 [Nitrososphaerota archaeon]|nr:hypothetical protein [Aigarchaeota archaeon]MDW8076596.1 hypothetical protein [Nitrososphaerota archaeon]